MDMITTDAPAVAETRWIELTLIDIPSLARRHDPDRVASLAQDMAVNGQLQEIVVVPNGDRFEVAAGVGRTAAARQLKWEKIRCLIKGGVSEFDRLRITFAENEEREDASPLYQAKLLEKMKISGNFSNQEDFAKKLGKSQPVLSQYLSLLDLEPKVQNFIDASIITLRQALELKRLPNADLQLKIGEECAKSDLSGKALKARVDQLIKAEGAREQGSKGTTSPSSPSVPHAPSASPDLVWKGEIIAINRGFNPSQESVQDYIAWLTLALQAFAETRPVPKAAAQAHANPPIQLPQTDAEMAELEALGKSGPGPIYEKLAPGSPLVEVMRNMTWADFGAKDVKDGLPQLLAALKVTKCDLEAGS